MSRKVKINLVGGVGNQLFTYCAGYYLSIQRATKFNPQILMPAFGDTKHNSSINDLTIFPKAIQKSKIQSKVLRIISTSRRRLINHLAILDSALMLRRYSSEVIGYDEKFEYTNANYVDGYFQTYKYVEAIIQKNPSFVSIDVEKPSNWYLKMRDEIISGLTIGIHVRGGDYLKDVNREIGSLSLEYYDKAISSLKEIANIENYKILVFSDDLEYARSLLSNSKIGFDVHYVSPPLDSKPTESLMLMSRTNIRIISNSTFAWWAGYLGSKDGLVIAPNKWFKAKKDPKALIPDTWKVCESSWVGDESGDRAVKE